MNEAMTLSWVFSFKNSIQIYWNFNIDWDFVRNNIALMTIIFLN